MSWTRDGSPLNASGRISFSDDKKRLTITNVNRTDSGEYQCVAKNRVGSDTSKSASLNVQCKFNILFQFSSKQTARILSPLTKTFSELAQCTNYFFLNGLKKILKTSACSWKPMYTIIILFMRRIGFLLQTSPRSLPTLGVMQKQKEIT